MKDSVESRRPFCRDLDRELRKRFDFVSVLATDSKGVQYLAAGSSPHADSPSSEGTPAQGVESGAEESMWSERGYVIRAQQAGRIAEFAFNHEDSIQGTTSRVIPQLEALLESTTLTYPPIRQGGIKQSWHREPKRDPETSDPSEAFAAVSGAVASMLASHPSVVSARSRFQSVRVSKLYIAGDRELDQRYVWSDGNATAITRNGEGTQKMAFQTVSGIAGFELLEELAQAAPKAASMAVELLGAGKVEGGEWDVILDPDAAGTLAHEAFGHGVETDMFVKGRALASSYLGKQVASPLVTMYDGAEGTEQTGSYLFDDEGTLAKKTLVIDKGILVSGFGDLLSASTLGIEPSGNGRRQAFDHRAYARMTNTYFEPGKDRLQDMIASIDRGWLLERTHSGMEDPKNWGIQLMLLVGREIVDGRLTGRMVSPVVCTGFVPDVLKAISMVSEDFHLSGSGYCGKGYKEFVKVSSGGPYVKTRMRLG